MLVTLGVNQALSAGGSVTLSYSPESVQKVMIFWDDESGTDAFSGTVTVQIGSTTVCNGISNYGLIGITQLQGSPENSTSQAHTTLDFGSIICGPNENLYVTISASAAISYNDVSAIVNEPMAGAVPMRYTEYADTTFTAENVMMALSYDSAKAVVDEDNYVCEIRTPTYASSPNFISANNWYQSEALTNNWAAYFALLAKNQIPMNTSFNYSSSAVTDRIITLQAMGITKYGEVKANSLASNALKANKKVVVNK